MLEKELFAKQFKFRFQGFEILGVRIFGVYCVTLERVASKVVLRRRQPARRELVLRFECSDVIIICWHNFHSH